MRGQARFNPGEAAVNALQRRYARWATTRALQEDGVRFSGPIQARDVIFAPGLAGSYPSPPELIVMVELDVPAPVLLKQREDEETGSEPRVTALLRELLAVSEWIRNLGVTRHFVRITFEPGVEASAFDAALEALEERLRLHAGEGAVPYR